MLEWECVVEGRWERKVGPYIGIIRVLVYLI